MSDERLNITMDPRIAKLLRSTGNASAYIEQVIRDRWQDWQGALLLLGHFRWSRAEIEAAAAALNGVLFDRTLAATVSVPTELGDPRKIEHLVQKHELDRARWKKRVEQCKEEVIAHAVVVVVREYWTHNAALEAALARLDDTRWKVAKAEMKRGLRVLGWGSA